MSSSEKLDIPLILDLMSQVCKSLDAETRGRLILPSIPVGAMVKLVNGRRMLFDKLVNADALTVQFFLGHPVLVELKCKGLLHQPLDFSEKAMVDRVRTSFVKGWKTPNNHNALAIMMLYFQAFELPLMTEGLNHLDRRVASAYLDYCSASPLYINMEDEQKHVDFLTQYINWCCETMANRSVRDWAVRTLLPSLQKLDLCGPLTAECDISPTVKARARLINTLNSLLQTTNVQELEPLDRKLSPTKGRKIRIGYMVSTLGFGPDMKTILAEIGEFYPDKIEIYLYSRDSDDLTSQHNVSFYRRLFARITEARSLRGLSTEKVINLIRADDLDIFVFNTASDYGFGFYDLALAHRVASLQIVPSGMIPISTWLDSFDFYLLPRGREDLLAPLAAQASEKLLLTPGSILAYDRRDDPMPEHIIDRATLGVKDDEALFLCCGAAPKLVPSVCDAFARILATVPKAKLVLATLHPDLGGEKLWPILETRMGVALKRHGVGRDRVVVLNRMEPQDMPQLLGLADVYLSQWPLGGATWITMCLDSATPIVVKDSDLMHGLGNQSLMRGAGLEELVASDAEDYVRLAVDLATDKQRNEALRHKMKEAKPFMQHNDVVAFSKQRQELYLRLVDDAVAKG